MQLTFVSEVFGTLPSRWQAVGLTVTIKYIS